MSEPEAALLEYLRVPASTGTEGYNDHASRAEAILNGLKVKNYSASSFSDSGLLLLTAYTNPDDPWTTLNSALTARSILSSLPPDRTPTLIVDAILQGYLRPIFSKSTSKITTSGRPSQYTGQESGLTQEKSGWEEPTWKRTGLTSIPSFAWAVEASDSNLIKSNWPLFTPVLLTLLEDRETSIRKTGLGILLTFLDKLPSSILRSTGIGTVFQEAVFPSLFYLPSLTPEAESAPLLRAGCAALLALAKSIEDARSEDRRNHLDKLLRDGVFAAHYHASEYALIVEVLMDVITEVLAALGIYSAKHLQKIISMISSAMTEPFATAHGRGILSACKALNTCIRECWPLMTEERSGEIMRVLMMCWVNIHSASILPKPADDITRDIETEIKLAAAMLQAIRERNNLPMPSELREILKEKPQLKILFP